MILERLRLHGIPALVVTVSHITQEDSLFVKVPDVNTSVRDPIAEGGRNTTGFTDGELRDLLFELYDLPSLEVHLAHGALLLPHRFHLECALWAALLLAPGRQEGQLQGIVQLFEST